MKQAETSMLLCTIIAILVMVLLTIAVINDIDTEEIEEDEYFTYSVTNLWEDNSTVNVTYHVELNHTKVIEVVCNDYNVIALNDTITLDKDDNIIEIFPAKF